ncbi:MAG: MFS transporter [Microscillaceae bacterium]|nr:MFS transporter [Microscillaceae bacterium]
MYFSNKIPMAQPMPPSPPPPPLWTPLDFVLMTLVNLFISAGSFMLIPVLPLYARAVMGASEAQIGYIIGIYTLSALLLRPIAGILLDTVGRRPTYLVGLLCFALLLPFYAWTTALAPLFALRFAHGLTWGVVTTGGNTIASDIVPMARRGEGIGYFGMSFTIAMALGPVLGLVLIQKMDYSLLFYISAATVGCTFLLANMVRYPQIAPVSRQNTRRLRADMIIDRRVVPTSLIALVCSAVYGGLISFITLFMEETGIQTGYPLLDSGAVFFMAYALGLTIVRPFAGRQMDKKGPAGVLGFGFLTLMLGLFGLASVSEIIGFLMASFVCGTGMGVILPTVITMVVNMVEPSRRGVANSTFFSAVDIGVGLGTILLGMVAEAFSITTMYYLCSALIALPLVYFFAFVQQDYQRKKQPEVLLH